MAFRIALSAFIGLVLAGCSSPALAKDPPGVNSEGRRLYIAKCAKCHKFYEPANYSADEWEMWMAKMSKKSRLKPEQEAELSRYIAQNLRAPNFTNTPTLKR